MTVERAGSEAAGGFREEARCKSARALWVIRHGRAVQSNMSPKSGYFALKLELAKVAIFLRQGSPTRGEIEAGACRRRKSTRRAARVPTSFSCASRPYRKTYAARGARDFRVQG